MILLSIMWLILEEVVCWTQTVMQSLRLPEGAVDGPKDSYGKNNPIKNP